MKIITATLLISVALLLAGCASPEVVPPLPPPPIVPLYGANAPSPIVEPPKPDVEPQLLIFNRKVELLADDFVAISFETNVPATSKAKLITNETIITTESIIDKVQYHYYKFNLLKSLVQYYVSIEATANTSDSTVISFRTEGQSWYPTYPPANYYPFFSAPYYPYYVPPPTPPVIPAVTTFWTGSVSVTVVP
jgi:hypothetical protein